jgi:hypothetical protein
MSATANARRHVIKILHERAGDKKIQYDPNNPDDIEDAQASFDFWTKEKGHRAYAIDKSTGKKTGSPITKFDPALGEILMVPLTAMQGG